MGTAMDTEAADETLPQQPKRRVRGPNKTPGRLPSSTEDQVFQALSVQLDDAHNLEVELLMAGKKLGR